MAADSTAFSLEKCISRRRCSKCGVYKPHNEFYRRKKGMICIECEKIQKKQYRMTHKRCSKCGKYKSTSDFSADNCQRSGLHPSCKDCVALYGKKRRMTDAEIAESKRVRARKYYWQNKEKHKQRSREYHKNNREILRLKSRCKNVGITVEQFRDMFSSHNGNCDICGVSQSDLTKPLYIDHDHVDGGIRGLLCPNCNSMLGHARDNLDILVAGFQYLVNHKENRRAS